MWTSIFIVLGGVILLVAVAAVAWWVRRMDSDMEYPGAHGTGLRPEMSDAVRLGTSSAAQGVLLGPN